MNIKKTFVVLGIIGGVALIGLLYFGFLFFTAFGGLNFLISVPKPEITYGEFPFKLTYELNGEIKTIEDIVICEFDGFEVIGEAGKYRKWKTSLKSGNERVTLLDLRPLKEVNEFGQRMLEMFFSYGSGEYYMGDEQRYSLKPEIRDYIEYEYKNADGTTGGSSYKADVAYEKYKIRLISWDTAPPIQNNFK